MPLTSLISRDRVVHGIATTSQKALFRDLVTIFSDSGALDNLDISEKDVIATALERERLGSTGVGNGVALPHARIDGLDSVYAAFATLNPPLDYNAVDERPVDLVVMLLAPTEDSSAHLRALAKVSRLLRREDMRARLRAAPDAESLYISLTDDHTANAA